MSIKREVEIANIDFNKKMNKQNNRLLKTDHLIKK